MCVRVYFQRNNVPTQNAQFERKIAHNSHAVYICIETYIYIYIYKVPHAFNSYALHATRQGDSKKRALRFRNNCIDLNFVGGELSLYEHTFRHQGHSRSIISTWHGHPLDRSNCRDILQHRFGSLDSSNSTCNEKKQIFCTCMYTSLAECVCPAVEQKKKCDRTRKPIYIIYFDIW